MFIREQLKSKEEVIHSLLQQLAKCDNIVVECNQVSGHETSDKMHCSMLSDHKEVKQNTAREELLLDTSIIVNETDNMNSATENRNLTVKTGYDNKHQQNRKKYSEQEKDRKPHKEKEKEKSVTIISDSMVKHLHGWELSKKMKNCKVYVRSVPFAKVQCMNDYKKPSMRDEPDHFIAHVGTND